MSKNTPVNPVNPVNLADLGEHPVTSWPPRLRRLLRDDQGLSTIEYAMGTLAAAAIAAVLYVVVNSGGVSDAIEGIITGALENTPG